MAKKKIKFMCTAFRDGFQSVYGARVATKDYIPAIEAARAAGIDHFESGGGAMFQSLFFYCRENAFDAMDAFRKAAGPNADLQTLSRGVNVVGLESQSSDIIKLHAQMFKKHGVSSIRNFDALNDVNNLIYSGKVITEAGLNHQVCVTLMELPPGCTGAHDPAFYMKTLRAILDAGIPYTSVCFKDASGTSTPTTVYETIKQARKMLPAKTIIHFHTHETAGTGAMTYKAAIDAGADLIDLSLSPCSGGTCQTDVLTMWHALRGTEYDLDVDVEKVLVAEEIFMDCMKDYFLPPEACAVEPLIPWSPMPGGALTSNTQMLRDNGIMNKYDEIIKAMSEVVRKGGFGTSVTPVSQFYFQQAFNNVMFGPWKKIADGYGKMVLGYFGKTPVEPDPEVLKICAEQLKLEPTKKTVLEINDADPKKGSGPAKKLLTDAGLPLTDENIFITATCREKGIAFLQGKGEMGIRKNEKPEPKPASTPKAKSDSGSYTVNVGGNSYAVVIEGDYVTVNGVQYATSIFEGISAEAAAMPVAAAPAHVTGAPTPAAAPAQQRQAARVTGGKTTSLTAPMPAKVFKIIADVGDHVNVGDPVIIIEAMKMETAINATVSGTISKINFAVGDQVESNDVVATITEGGSVQVEATPQPQPAASAAPAPAPATPAPQKKSASVVSGGKTSEFSAPMPGKVFKIVADVGDQVNVGDPIIILEAMKMEMAVNATVKGTVTKINVAIGDQVESNQVLGLLG
jgi:pyruvate carboxylase subunit B